VFRRIMTICLAAGILGTLQAPAEAALVSDPNEPPTRLDIRSASVVQLTEKLEVTLVFWGRTPQWLLRRHAARIEMSSALPKHADSQFGFRFWPNKRGQLRITWGEPGSACCGRQGARHPDPFTYTAVIPVSLHGLGIQSFRASRTARLPTCWHVFCYLTSGRIVDKTVWVRT
jgi:hypothetical protein